MNIKIILISIFVTILYITSISLSTVNSIDLSLALNIVACIFMIFTMKKINKSYSNATMIFYVFSVLYGLSGPINAYWGEGLADIFGSFYDVGSFLIVFSISNIGLLYGVIFYKFTNNKYSGDAKKNLDTLILKKETFLNLAVFLSFVSMIFEITNFLRVGGFSALIRGKAYYQSIISELTFTLPSDYFVDMAFVFMALYIGTNLYQKRRNNKAKIIQFLIYMIPYLLINIFLGKRGVLLSIVLIIFVGITFFNPIKNIKPKLLVIVLSLYIVMGFLYANRGITSLLLTDTDTFLDMAFNKERIVKALNPGINEFGAPFGNFNMFYIHSNDKYTLLFGESYVKGLLLMIPSFAYPGEKPQQIAYVFRDTYFPSEASRGSIAGTAFSSILEAYWNFSYVGVFFIYFFIGYILQKFDNKLKYKNSLFTVIYVSIIPLTVRFHRVAFGNILATFIFKIIIAYFIFYVIGGLAIFNRRNNSVIQINYAKERNVLE